MSSSIFFHVVDVGFASIHYSKYGPDHPVSDYILATKWKIPSFIRYIIPIITFMSIMFWMACSLTASPPWSWHKNWISLVLPHPVSPMSTTGIPHLIQNWDEKNKLNNSTNIFQDHRSVDVSLYIMYVLGYELMIEHYHSIVPLTWLKSCYCCILRSIQVYLNIASRWHQRWHHLIPTVKTCVLRLWSHRSISYMVLTIRYTICSPPQTGFCSFHATSLECSL